MNDRTARNERQKPTTTRFTTAEKLNSFVSEINFANIWIDEPTVTAYKNPSTNFSRNFFIGF